MNQKKANEKLLYHIAQEVNGIILSLPKALEIMSEMRAKSVLQRHGFNGFLEITPSLCIAVKTFIKSKPTTFPTLKKASLISKELGEPDRTVEMERTYHSIDELDTDISNKETVKGYKYGRSLVSKIKFFPFLHL